LYVISFLTELRCTMSTDNSKQAMVRIEEGQLALKKIAAACFDQMPRPTPTGISGRASNHRASTSTF
jgi:hypothetical protein